MKPYSSARDEFEGEAAVFLDANENPYFGPLNRYPDPQQRKLKKVISAIKSLPGEMIFLGNGSDEAIDILIRAFCEPGRENIVSVDPTYGMYEVTAAINGVEYRKVQLGEEFRLDEEALRQQVDSSTKIIFLCSPNNPTGNSIEESAIKSILKWFNGILVIDEAYIDFSEKPGLIDEIVRSPRLVVLQTLSKAWGRAGIRLGMAFGNADTVSVMNKIKPPYNVNSLTMQEALATFSRKDEKTSRVKELVASRSTLGREFGKLKSVLKVYPSDANFLLIRVDDAARMYRYLASSGIIVRNRSGSAGCDNCLRITVGTAEENNKLLEAMKEYEDAVPDRTARK